jgi:hypothetical protein
MKNKKDAYTAAMREAIADAVADEARAEARKQRQQERLAAQRDTPPPDPATSLQSHLAALDGRLANLREHQRRGDALAAKLIKHVETERAEVMAKLRGQGPRKA